MISTPMRRLLPALLALAPLLLGAAPPPSQSPPPPGDADWARARPGYAWSFPRDHWAHPGYRNEWWYLTGQLTPAGATEPRFGYQFTFFRIGIAPEPLPFDTDWATGTTILGHAAITDLAAGRHRFAEVLQRAHPALAGLGREPEPLLCWSRAPAGTSGRWTIRWNGRGFDLAAADDVRGFSFALSTRAEKPLVFQGPGGLSRKAPDAGAASLYYSFPRLATTGRVVLDGEAFEVTGRSWMDKEFSSNQLTEEQAGWDWLSLSLHDGRDLMLYRMRRTDGTTDWKSATLIDAAGSPRHLPREAWSMTPLSFWKSPETGARYPLAWRVRVPSAKIDLRIAPLVEAQENRSRLVPSLFYWEGAIVARDGNGPTLGRGYLELTGYGPGSRPPL